MTPPDTTQIVDAAATALLTFNPDFHLAWMNPAAEELFAVGLRQGTGHTLSEVLPGRTDLVHHARTIQVQPRVISEREVWVARPGEDGRLVDITLSPLPWSGEEVGLLVEAALSDRRSRIAQEGRRIEEQRALRRVIRGLAHEIKNPLGGLRGAAQLLASHVEDPEMREYTDVIEHEVDRLRGLLNQLQGPGGSRQRTPVNIHEVLERVRRLTTAEAAKTVALRADYDPSLPPVRGDFDQLVQVFLNLAANAAQAVADRRNGEVILRTRIERNYTIEGRKHPLALRVDIEDNGPGIPESEQSQIFYPLVTSRAEGRGLGLAIAQDLITAHGGVIDLTSTPGQTVFQVVLPLERALASETDTEEAA